MPRKIKRLSVGTRIRRLRESQNMSLDELANESGFAAGYLGQIEADEAIPPVAALLRLGRALDLDSGELLKDEEEDMAEKRAEAEQTRTAHYSYQLLTPQSRQKHLKGFLITIDPQSDLEGGTYQHEGEEFHYVLKGQLQVTVGDNVNVLEAGESLHFNSNLLHKLRNVGQEACEILVVLFVP